MPRRSAFAIRQFSLDEVAVLDVGCGSGLHLQHFGPGSLGLDINVGRAWEAGLPAQPWNFTEELPPDLADRFDVVWASNVLEHVLAPHEFLIRLRRALRPRGRIVVVVPATRAFDRSAWRGHLAADHINFFTGRTLRLTVERAGYHVSFLGSPSIPELPRGWARLLTPLAPVIMAAGAAIADFQYPEKAHKSLVEGSIEWKTSHTLGHD